MDIHNISACNLGLMGYKTPNIDRIAKEGALFTDAHAQQSCTAGRASFMGEDDNTIQYWRFVFVQQVMAKELQTFLEFPPMQHGASFNLDAVKAEMAKRMAQAEAGSNVPGN